MADLSRTYGMHSETFYAWKRRCIGMHSGDVQKLRQMTEESARLRKVVANFTPLAVEKRFMTISS